MNPTVDTGLAKSYLLDLQARIVAAVEAKEGKTARVDDWHKAPGEPLGGSGRTVILENGAIFERAGVGFSHVTGDRLPPSASASRPELAGRGFEAMGVSLVFHPRNPYAPTVHMNVRLFVARASHALDVWWIGGGMDLTPYYGFDEDAIHFHRQCQEALSPFDATLYDRFKRWCDEYFFLRHRQEARGVGGIFFDDFHEFEFARSWAMLQSVGDHFLPAYWPILERRCELTYGERERDWQTYRRGRYVEFNLVYDRGTLFGLQSGGRAESILMSLPPCVQWSYRREPAAGSAEALLASRYLRPRDWLT